MTTEIDWTKMRRNWVVEDATSGLRFVTLNLYRTDDFTLDGNLRQIRPATAEEVEAREKGLA